MGHSFDMLIFDFLLKLPQPITGLFFLFCCGQSGFRLMGNQVIFNIGRMVDKACIYTMNSQW